MSAREVIAQTLFEFSGNGQGVDDMLAEIANAQTETIIDALTAAGYRILGPSELDVETMERCAKLIESGYDKPVGKPWRKDGKPSKNDECPHGRYMYEDCEPCAVIALRALAGSKDKGGRRE